MSLPNDFNNSHEYFREAVNFLKQNSWIYREANTMFIKNGILNEMPQVYKDYFSNIKHEELHQFPYVHQPLDAHKTPATIITFRQKLAKLIAEEAYHEPKYIEKQKPKSDNLKKMNIKKQHEIQRLATVVKDVIKLKDYDKNNMLHEEKCVLIDFGSGLGYLSELLYKLNENLLILGLEADTYRVEAAEKRVKAYMPTGCNAIQYRQQFITENSKVYIVDAVEELLKLNYYHTLTQQQQQPQVTTKMAIIGLHACADLTITSMKLFFQLPQVQYLIIMPCCYHKLHIMDDSSVCKTNAAAAATATADLKFRNFPISESLKKVLLANESDKSNYASKERVTEHYITYLNRPFLRLACQQTLKRWSRCSPQAHCAHGCEMFLRAVAESLHPKQRDMELMIVKRKEEKIDFNSLTMEQRNAFETFKSLYALKSKNTNDFIAWTESHRKTFDDIMEKHSNGCKLAEGLTCLQTSMQKLCENLVLYDRLCYMEETALNLKLNVKVRYEKIMDEELSPRCYVLIAEKL